MGCDVLTSNRRPMKIETSIFFCNRVFPPDESASNTGSMLQLTGNLSGRANVWSFHNTDYSCVIIAWHARERKTPRPDKGENAQDEYGFHPRGRDAKRERPPKRGAARQRLPAPRRAMRAPAVSDVIDAIGVIEESAILPSAAARGRLMM